MSSPYFSHSKYSEQALQNRLQNAGLEYLCYRRQNLDPDDQLIIECCWLNCASVVSLRRPSASRLTLLRTHRRGINSNFIHDLLKANLKPNHIFQAMLLWSKFNPSCIVSQKAFELSIWEQSGDISDSDYLETIRAPSFTTLETMRFIVHAFDECMDGWVDWSIPLSRLHSPKMSVILMVLIYFASGFIWIFQVIWWFLLMIQEYHLWFTN